MLVRALLALLLLLPPIDALCRSFPVTFEDSTKNAIGLEQPPTKVVSLVPSITEILFALGAEENLVGLTHHSSHYLKAQGKTVVGGFINPDPSLIRALKPDLVFHASLHDGFIDELDPDTITVNLSAQSIPQSFEHIRLLGRIFAKSEAAELLITKQQRLLQLIADKTESIPQDQRPRVVRLMSSNNLMVPGDDSFQNDYIRQAGGIAPVFGQDGQIISIGLDEWQDFNPEIIYTCSNGDRDLPILQKPGWNEVDAVINNKILFFPCDLTCRVATNSGYFVAWLSATIHQEYFSDPKNQVLPDGVVSTEQLAIVHDYVKSGSVVHSNISDFPNKSLLIEFTRPMTILSTLDGWRDNIRTIGNHYFPPPAWGLGHESGLAGLKRRTYAALGRTEDEMSMLFTGADMDNLAISEVSYEEMRVTALVTAGVSGNSMKMAADQGLYYELSTPHGEKNNGTINMVLLSNTTLSPRAMTRALITATEAKTAALRDLDIRSNYSGMHNAATGTGTDNIMIAQGAGPTIDNSGGHSKMGELIARSVYQGVQEAVVKQSGIISQRSVYQRARERGIDLMSIGRSSLQSPALIKTFEQLMLQERYQSFMHSAFAISDHYETGLITDLTEFSRWCQLVAKDIGGDTTRFAPLDDPALTTVLQLAFGAIISGLQTISP